jgi:endonuclease YncB( thermonuclease family)
MRLIGLRICYTIFLVSIFGALGHSQTYTGRITKVVDGDTYFFQTAKGTLKVRSFGIDAPEGNQPFGTESAAFLSRYLHKDATLVAHSHDQYKRTLGTLFVDGQDINLLSVKGGYAWHYKRYFDDKQYAVAQDNARKNKLGLWKLSNPIPPWNWRHVEKENGTFHHK